MAHPESLRWIDHLSQPPELLLLSLTRLEKNVCTPALSIRVTFIVLEEFSLLLKTCKHAEYAFADAILLFTQLLRAILIIFLFIDNLQCRTLLGQIVKRLLRSESS